MNTSVPPKYPTRREFESLLMTRPIDWVIDNHLFNGMPFYSSHQPEIHQQMTHAISSGLKVPKHDICVVGSARIGFSLSPLKFGEPFSPFSDIDVFIVSTCLFDPSWIDILETRRSSHAPLSGRTRTSLRDHREHHYLFNGWMYPDSVIEVLNIGQRWLRTFRGLSRITELASRPIGARLYRTWDHARLYHRWSLSKLKQQTSDIT